MPRPRHGTVVAYLALFVALAGSAYAAVKIGSKQIRNNSVKSRDIRNRTIATKDISPSAQAALKGQTGPTGPAGAGGAQGPAGQSAVPERTVVVGAGGTPAENATALRTVLSGLQATADDPRSVQLGAGRYDVNGTTLTVPPDVTLRGAGTRATIIESSPANVQLSVLALEDRAEVADLTVRTESAALGSVGIDETAGNDGSIRDVTVQAGVGIIKRGGLIDGVDVNAFGTGVRALNVSSGRVLTIRGSRIGAFGSGVVRALHASDTFTVSDSRLYAASQTIAVGIRYDANSGVPSVRASLVDVSGISTGYGIEVDTPNDSPRVEVDASEINASGPTQAALRAEVGNIRAGATELGSGVAASVASGGEVTCVNTYSSAYAAVAC